MRSSGRSPVERLVKLHLVIFLVDCAGPRQGEMHDYPSKDCGDLTIATALHSQLTQNSHFDSTSLMHQNRPNWLIYETIGNRAPQKNTWIFQPISVQCTLAACRERIVDRALSRGPHIIFVPRKSTSNGPMHTSDGPIPDHFWTDFGDHLI